MEHQTDIVMDEDSRDSGVSVNSNNGYTDSTSSQFTVNAKNEYDVKVSSMISILQLSLI